MAKSRSKSKILSKTKSTTQAKAKLQARSLKPARMKMPKLQLKAKSNAKAKSKTKEVRAPSFAAKPKKDSMIRATPNTLLKFRLSRGASGLAGGTGLQVLGEQKTVELEKGAEYAIQGGEGGGNFDIESQLSVTFSVARANSEAFGKLIEECKEALAGHFGVGAKAHVYGGAWGGGTNFEIEMAIGKKRFGNLCWGLGSDGGVCGLADALQSLADEAADYCGCESNEGEEQKCASVVGKARAWLRLQEGKLISALSRRKETSSTGPSPGTSGNDEWAEGTVEFTSIGSVYILVHNELGRGTRELQQHCTKIALVRTRRHCRSEDCP